MYVSGNFETSCCQKLKLYYYVWCVHLSRGHQLFFWFESKGPWFFIQLHAMGPWVFLLALTSLHRSHALINFDQSPMLSQSMTVSILTLSLDRIYPLPTHGVLGSTCFQFWRWSCEKIVFLQKNKHKKDVTNTNLAQCSNNRR